MFLGLGLYDADPAQHLSHHGRLGAGFSRSRSVRRVGSFGERGVLFCWGGHQAKQKLFGQAKDTKKLWKTRYPMLWKPSKTTVEYHVYKKSQQLDSSPRQGVLRPSIV